MADLTAYGTRAEAGEAAAREAIALARQSHEPGFLSAFMIQACRAEPDWQDGAFHALAEEILGARLAPESQPNASKGQAA